MICSTSIFRPPYQYVEAVKGSLTGIFWQRAIDNSRMQKVGALTLGHSCIMRQPLSYMHAAASIFRCQSPIGFLALLRSGVGLAPRPQIWMEIARISRLIS